MLEVHFIENFPVGNRIVITRLVLLSVLVLKSTFGVPSQESCIVVRNFLERGVAQCRTLFIVPQALLRTIPIRDGFLRLVHPLRAATESPNDRITTPFLYQITSHSTEHVTY